jgi:type I restriction enzyme S subunit
MSLQQPKIDLSPSNWNELVSILQRYVPNLDVWAFGSRVKWTAKQYSDLDLALITEKPLPLEEFSSLKEAFDNSVLPMRVDVVDWATTSQSFKEIIEKDKVVIQKAINNLESNSGWLYVTLGEICTAQKGAIQTGPFGSQLHTSDYKEIGIPVVMPTNIGDGGIDETGIARIDQSDVERLSQHKLRVGDIVFSRRGDVTKNALIRPHEVGWLCGTGCLKVRLGDESKARAKFISYCLRHPDIKDWLIRHAVGATMPNLNTAILSAVPIHLPPLKDQLEIASILGVLDDRITLLRETNTTLEAIAQALFKSWFVDFDPVRAKMEGREPEGAVQGSTSVAGGRMPEATLDAETAALFPDSFEESELGLVPRGWEIGKVDAVLSRLSAKIRFTKDQVMSNGDTPIYEQGAGILLGYHEGKAQYQVDENDPAFIFGDHTCVTHLSCEPFDISQNVIPLKGKDRATLWVFYAVKDKQSFQEYRRHWMELVVKDIIIPPAQICEAFAKTVNVFHLKMESNARQSRTLTNLRDTLLPRLISGQLRLPEAEALLETV